MLDLLSSTDVGRMVPPLEERSDVGSEASEGDLWECQEGQEERKGEAEARCAAGDGQELPLLLPTPSFMASAGEN